MTTAQIGEELQRIASGYIYNAVLDSTGLKGSWDFTLSFSSANLTKGRGDGSEPNSSGTSAAPDRGAGTAHGLRPLFRDKYSPDLVPALFSRWLAQPQLDWPRQTIQTGFVYFDRQKAEDAPSTELTAFFAAGDAPIVFTQGSIAVHHPGGFYEVSIEAAKRLGRRAVLLGAKTMAEASSSQVLVLPYLPYSQVFPHGAVNVHQGGSGTSGQALRAGRPMLVVPYGWDQPDNAARIERLGAGLHLARTNYSPDTTTKALHRLLHEPHFARRAAQVGAAMKEENGEALACDAIEAVLTAHNTPVSSGKSLR
jgi:rhamnosyltransferase subunit B